MKTITLASLAVIVLAGCADGSSSSSDPPSADEGALHGGTNPAAANGNKLSAAQRRTVLSLIDDVCGDTWCEGDFNYSFDKMNCDFAQKTCTMTMKIIAPGADDHTPAKTYIRSCKMTDVKGYDDMVEKLRFGDNLKQDFYGKVDDCVTRASSSVPNQ